MSNDYSCPDCRVENERGVLVGLKWCGLSLEEHLRMDKLRKEAEKQAHQLIVEGREQQLLPQAIIKAIYDEAERAARRRRP